MATSKIKNVDAYDEVYYGWGTTNSNGLLKLRAPRSWYIPIGAISAQTGKIATVAYRDADDAQDFWLLFTDTALHPLATTGVAVYVLFMPYASHNLLWHNQSANAKIWVATSTITFDKSELVTACNVTFSKYLDNSGAYQTWKTYYTAEIPVLDGMSICVFNSADNTGAYSWFFDINGTKVGTGIAGRGNGQKGFGQYYTVPTGAVSLKVSMYNEDHCVLSKMIW